jgi:hypothetical protein
MGVLFLIAVQPKRWPMELPAVPVKLWMIAILPLCDAEKHCHFDVNSTLQIMRYIVARTHRLTIRKIHNKDCRVSPGKGSKQPDASAGLEAELVEL